MRPNTHCLLLLAPIRCNDSVKILRDHKGCVIEHCQVLHVTKNMRAPKSYRFVIHCQVEGNTLKYYRSAD